MFHLQSCIIPHTTDTLSGDLVSLEKHRQERRTLSLEKEHYPLTPEEELLLLQTFRSKIQDTCRLFRFPKETSTVAHWYLLRYYYLGKGGLPAGQQMKYLMLAACLLACKHENQHPTKTSLTTPSVSLDFTLLQKTEIELLSALEHQISFKSIDFTLLSLLSVLDVTLEKDTNDCFSLLYQIVEETTSLLLYSPLELASIAVWCVLGKSLPPPSPPEQQQQHSNNFSLEQSSKSVQSQLEAYSNTTKPKLMDIKFIRELDQKLQQPQPQPQ